MLRRARVRTLAFVFLICSSACADTPTAPSTLTGRWGGDHVVFTLSDSGGRVEFDCAHGDLSGPLQTDSQSRFSVSGTFVREGGPVSQNPPAAQSAVYDGSVSGDTMILRLRVVDGNEPL